MSLINNRTPDQILNDFIATFSATQPDINLNEASTIYILFQIYSFISSLNVATAQSFALSAFIEQAIGDDLTSLAKDRGVTRIVSTPSSTTLTFSRIIPDYINSYTIPVSSQVTTVPDENGDYYVFQTLSSVTLPASSLTVTVTGESILGGIIYNVPSGTITNFLSPINGIDEVTNTDAVGGTDTETDDELRTRIRLELNNNSAKNTISGYENSLLALGCKSAYVYSASASMPNYITAVVTSPSTVDTIPTGGELSNWNTLINGDSYRAVCDNITVVAPTTITITVSGAITAYETGVDTATVLAGVKSSIIAYINALSPGETLYLTDLQAVMHGYTGVVDFVIYDPTSNTITTNTQKVVANTGTVTIN